MNFLQKDGDLSKFLNNRHHIDSLNKISKKRSITYVVIIASFILVAFSFIYQVPIKFISGIESNVLANNVSAVNVKVIKNVTMANLNKIAGVHLINPNLKKATILAEVTPKQKNLVGSSVGSTVNISAGLLQRFLVTHGSPMAPFAGDFISAAHKYGVNWRLIVAISGVESGFGRVIPESSNGALSYNAWGWTGGSGTFNGFANFSSWSSAIYAITSGIAHAYGNQSPFVMQPVYDPPNPQWSYEVQSYMNQL